MFSKDGQLLGWMGNHLGKSGKEEGDFEFPTGLCIVNYKLYVADNANRRIQVFI